MSAIVASIRRVLLVDDDRLLLRALVRVLSSRASLVAVPDAEAALAALDADDFDVVVSDHHMPGMLGDALLAAIARTPRHAALGLVLMSGSMLVDDLAPTLRDRVVFLEKPASADAILAAIAESVARSRSCAAAAASSL